MTRRILYIILHHQNNSKKLLPARELSIRSKDFCYNDCRKLNIFFFFELLFLFDMAGGRQTQQTDLQQRQAGFSTGFLLQYHRKEDNWANRTKYLGEGISTGFLLQYHRKEDN